MRTKRLRTLFFHKIFICCLVLYFFVYCLVRTFWLTKYSSAPLVVNGAFLVLHVLSFLLGRSGAWGDRMYFRVLSLTMVVSTATVALVHYRVQPQWIHYLGEAPDFGPGDWRIDGRLFLEWLLCYQILFLIPARHSMIASPVSIVVYDAILSVAGVGFDGINLAVLVIPVCLCIGGTAFSEKIQRQVDALVVELEELSCKEHTMRIEAEIAARQEIAATRRGILEEEAGSESGDVRGPRVRTLPEHGTEAESSTLDLSLSSSLAGAQASQPRLPSDAVQTAGVAAQDKSTETDIVWDKQGFRCKRCARPPRAPAVPGAGAREERPTPAARPPSASAPARRPSRQGQRKRGWPLRFAGFQETTSSTKAQMLSMSCLAWNARLDPKRCCDLHGLMSEAQFLTNKLLKGPCFKETAYTVSQCNCCLACSLDFDASTEYPQECRWCDEGFTNPLSGDGQGTDASESSESERRMSL